MTDNRIGLPEGHRILRRKKFLTATVPGANHGQCEDYAELLARAVRREHAADDGDDSGPAAA